MIESTSFNSSIEYRIRYFMPLAAALCLLAFLATVFEAAGQGMPEPEDLFFEFTMDKFAIDPDIEVDITDPLNRLLSIEETTDLTTWTSLGSVKVTNTNLYLTHTPNFSGHPAVYYRIKFDPDGQISNSEANILNLPETPFNYANIVLPAHLQVAQIQNTDNTPVGNPITDVGATLGRVLFYDKRLSISNTISCASCHHQDKGFTDGVQFSVGFEGGLTGRNSMGLAMARFYNTGRFFWDERAPTLEFQTTQPVRDAVEMGSAFPDVATEIGSEPYYQTLFTAAFPGSPTPTEGNIQLAIAQFVRSMVSYESKYDAGVPMGFINFTAQENLGRQLFFNNPNRPGGINCRACHTTDNFVQPVPRNNGLDLVTTDPGFGAVTGNPADLGKFKSGSLRNIDLTGPYMHDGRFETLEDVVQFYSTDIQDHPNLNGRLTVGPGAGGPPRTPNYTQAEVDALVGFMRTLTDTNFTTDPRWSDPFDYSGFPPPPDPTFVATFLTAPPLPLEADVTSITVGGAVATILGYDEGTGVVELLFDASSIIPGSYNALLTYTPAGGSPTVVDSANQFAVPGGPVPTFATAFSAVPPLPLLSEVTSITVGGIVATILSYDQISGAVALLFDNSSLAPGNYDALLTYIPAGGSPTVVTSTSQYTVVDPAASNNILLLIVDDWGLDMSPLDNTEPGALLANMPNLGSLAAGGLRFTNAYANPVCSPTRATLMTGRYPFQTTVWTPQNSGNFSNAVDETTLPEAFTASGSPYAMASMGKWHLGGGDTGYSDRGGWPEFYGITGGGVGDYFSWNKNSNGASANSTTYTTTDQVNEAVAFIGRSETAGDPWFCWVAFNAPHTPFHEPPASLEPVSGGGYTNEGLTDNASLYTRMQEALDTEIGRLLASVDPATTNIIIVGDNGTPNQVAQAPFGNGHSKGDLYEGGVHVPMVVKGPAVTVPPGSTTDKLVGVIDLFSTVLELAGIDPATVAPADAVAQSNSIVPILTGTDTADRCVVLENAGGRTIVVDDFPQYKLIIFGDPTDPLDTATFEFYNTDLDPNEQNDLLLSPVALPEPDQSAFNACFAKDVALGGGYFTP